MWSSGTNHGTILLRLTPIHYSRCPTSTVMLSLLWIIVAVWLKQFPNVAMGEVVGIREAVGLKTRSM